MQFSTTKVLKFFKLPALPTVIEPSSVYLIPSSVDGFLDIHVSSLDASKVLRVLNKEDVETIVQTKVNEILSQTTQVITKVYTFEETTSLHIEHNLNTDFYTYTIVNTNGDKVWANESSSDVNSFTIDFTEAEAGTISVIFYVNNHP